MTHEDKITPARLPLHFYYVTTLPGETKHCC